MIGSKPLSIVAGLGLAASALATIPEPAVWTLLLGGFTLIGTTRRRAKTRAVAA